MATSKTYVDVEKMVVKDVFDAKYKNSLPPIMQKTAEKAVKSSSKLTLDQPKEKGAKGYTLDASIVSLAPDKSGKQLQGECSMVISTWPGKSIKAMPSGKAGLDINDPAKIAAADVQALIEALVEAAMNAATKYMEKNSP
jgi:hypothetical protein